MSALKSSIASLIEAGVDVTEYGRTILVGGLEQLTPRLATVTEEWFADPAATEADGTGQATKVWVIGAAGRTADKAGWPASRAWLPAVTGTGPRATTSHMTTNSVMARVIPISFVVLTVISPPICPCRKRGFFRKRHLPPHKRPVDVLVQRRRPHAIGGRRRGDVEMILVHLHRRRQAVGLFGQVGDGRAGRGVVQR